MKTKFFAREFNGLNAALAEHNKTKRLLLQRINDTETDDIAKGSYRRLLNSLQESKAQLLESFGKK